MSIYDHDAFMQMIFSFTNMNSNMIDFETIPALMCSVLSSKVVSL